MAYRPVLFAYSRGGGSGFCLGSTRFPLMINQSPCSDIIILGIWLMGDKFRHVFAELRQYGRFYKDQNFNGLSSNPLGLLLL